MIRFHFTQEQLVKIAKLSDQDIAKINKCRRDHNKLGFAYQLCFVRLFNRFPTQIPFEVLEEVVTYIGVQLDVPAKQIELYQHRRETITEHRKRIQHYLQIRLFHQAEIKHLEKFLYQEALQIESTDSLIVKATAFLKNKHILNPAEDTLKRLIKTQRVQARNFIFEKVSGDMSTQLKLELDKLLMVDDGLRSQISFLKETPKNPSENSMRMLAGKLRMIEATGAMRVDLGWINNNYKRYLSNYARKSDAHKLKELSPTRRYIALICFLRDTYQDTIDYLFDTYFKALTKVHNNADKEVEVYYKSKRKLTRFCLTNHKSLCQQLIDIHVGHSNFESLFTRFSESELLTQVEETEKLLSGHYSNSLNLVADRFSHLRKLVKPLLENFDYEVEPTGNEQLLEAMGIVRDLIHGIRRKVPEFTELDFLPKMVQRAIVENGEINRKKFETAVYIAIAENIKHGNIAIKGSRRFGKFDDFFMDTNIWEGIRDDFFRASAIPQNPDEVGDFLKIRLDTAFSHFFKQEKDNKFAKAGEDGWTLSIDSGEGMTAHQKEELEKLKQWLSKTMRTIKLPDLLIEVDNDLYLTDYFTPISKRGTRTPEEVCKILTTFLAYGCNIGPHIMAQITEDISYKQIKHLFDWQFTEEAHRKALAGVVNGISNIEVTKVWGEGKTSASDGQRFAFKRKTINRTYSHRFNDFAIEFYTFVADNFAPFYNLAKETTDRDSSKVLDGHLYNVSDLEIEEHYTDTHGHTEINFAAFAMLGISFSPRIRNIKDQRLYKIDPNRDYGSLKHLLSNQDRIINLNHITQQWDRMGQFYASFKTGHITASTGLKKLTALTSKNNFYKANLALGRILKTEHILYWMSDPLRRKRTRKGLLKVEQIHSLARDLRYGNRGKLKSKDLDELNSSGSCLTLIIASIIYWQAKEMSRVIAECKPEEAGVNVELLEHVSPIEWSNVILYGEYKLNRSLIKQ